MQSSSSSGGGGGGGVGTTNGGGFLHSLLDGESSMISERGRAYGFVADFDLSLTLDDKFTPLPPSSDTTTSYSNAYGALLGGAVLDSSPLVYPAAMTQNRRDPNQVYVVSMHSDGGDVGDDDAAGGGASSSSMLNPEYTADYALEQEVDGILRERSDMTMGGAGLSAVGARLVGGGVPKYGSDFYVKVQQFAVTPYEE